MSLKSEGIMHSFRITTAARFSLLRISLISLHRCSPDLRRPDRIHLDDERSFRSREGLQLNTGRDTSTYLFVGPFLILIHVVAVRESDGHRIRPARTDRTGVLSAQLVALRQREVLVGRGTILTREDRHGDRTFLVSTQGVQTQAGSGIPDLNSPERCFEFGHWHSSGKDTSPKA